MARNRSRPRSNKKITQNQKPTKSASPPTAISEKTPENPKIHASRTWDIIGGAIFGLLATIIIPNVFNFSLPYFAKPWIEEKLIAYSIEGIAGNGRILEIDIKNIGRSKAEDVAVIIETLRPVFEFDDETHIHMTPNMPYVSTATKNRLAIKLDHPLNQGDRLLITIDSMPYAEDFDTLFTVGVSHKGGQSLYQGHRVRKATHLRADQIGFESVKSIFDHFDGSR